MTPMTPLAPSRQSRRSATAGQAASAGRSDACLFESRSTYRATLLLTRITQGTRRIEHAAIYSVGLCRARTGSVLGFSRVVGRTNGGRWGAGRLRALQG